MPAEAGPSVLLLLLASRRGFTAEQMSSASWSFESGVNFSVLVVFCPSMDIC